ncbi:hypothetical protein [Actinoplanes missouriensis]|uniref:hypothetical protein n=1 Tax=Actinoplanes missouriensis TaxID=1866 RepID=UPI00031BA007|nr:hypothetical protein [Actinoplanes missouriensis]
MTRTARAAASLSLALAVVASGLVLSAAPASAAKVRPTIDAAEVTKKGAPIKIVGKAGKGATVTIKFNGKAVKKTKANKSGRFSASVKATKGGKFTATASGHTSKADAIKVYVNQRRSETLYSGRDGGVGNFKSKTVTFRKGASITVKVATDDMVCTDSAPWIDPCFEYGYATVAILADLTSAMTGGDKYYDTETFEVYETSRGIVDVYSIDAENWTASAVQSWTARVYV